MGFFIRKSFRAGPVRLNLSKRGLGASVGVRGARIGISAARRAYVAGGRGGLYYRRNLTGSSRGGRRVAPAPASDPVVIEADTGVTYAPGDRPSVGNTAEPLLGQRPNHRVVLTLLGYPAAAFILLALILGASDQAVHEEAVTLMATLTFSLAAIAWSALAARQVLRAVRGRAFAKALPAALRGPAAPEDVPRLRAATRATPEEIAFHSRAAYLAYLHEAVADRQVEDAELARLSLLEREFSFSSDFVRAARASAFSVVYLEAVSDHDLDTAEEDALRHIRERLAIPDGDVAEELATVSRLGEIRAIREGQLPVIEATVKLQRGELCYFEGEGRLVKRRVLRRFQQGGEKHRVEGLTIDKEGTLLVTSKRLLLVHEGTTSIRLDRILEVEVDLDRNLLSVVKDGAQKPVLLTTADAQRAGAVLAAAAGV